MLVGRQFQQARQGCIIEGTYHEDLGDRDTYPLNRLPDGGNPPVDGAVAKVSAHACRRFDRLVDEPSEDAWRECCDERKYRRGWGVLTCRNQEGLH